ncbi:RNA polymerase sigma factor [Chitinophaga tropicalis]|uniref:Sigma-70 family RNA polymerase sigma factor n=1 Tax=Chitinophaga tropicalis TaxID=2683588 RepID=A0A7K1U197_9BACT|nr:sigma-70 family RNA polymerase sigma factor [Chitinophaga tropicalis]MVT07785.1 sigma-70 family RNA polymerase sigma factor [Chitinophaga tropicalis]
MYDFQHSGDDLMQRVAAGDEAAFAELFYTYHNRVGAFVLGWTRSQSMTDEIVQDVFMKIWTRRETLPVIRQIDSYLYILARNEAFNCLRQQAREKVKRENWEQEQEALPAGTEEQDYTPLIEKAVSLLPTQQRKVYLLKHHHHMAYAEIGKYMHISPETARKHLSAALRSIITYVRSHLHLILVLIISLRK